MKPVFQTLYGPGEGNCFQACVASLLEVAMDDLPHFCRDFKGDWLGQTNGWLNERFGVCLFDVPYVDWARWCVGMQGAYCIASGPNTQGVQHSVIGQVRQSEDGVQDVVMVHNPNAKPNSHVVDVTHLAFLILASGPGASVREPGLVPKGGA